MKNILSLIGLLLIFSACQRREQAIWPVQIKAPLAQASLKLTDLIADSLLITNADGSYNLLYEYETLLDSFGDVLNVPDTLNQISVNLNQLILEDRELIDTITLKEIMPESKLFDGSTVPLAAQDISNAGKQDIDISEAFFKKAKFNKGFLEISIYNDLPVYVDLIIFKLYNKVNQEVIANDTFRDIPPFGHDFKKISLAGKEVDGILTGELVRVKTRASDGPVLIDADKGLRLSLKVTELEPEYATAVFPSQNLISESQEVTYNFGGPQVTFMKIRSGFVKMTVISTIEEEIVLNYSIPQSSYNGQPGTSLVKEVRVPPAPRGTQSVVDEMFSIANYEILYKGKDPAQPPFTNTVYSELTARMESSGQERFISLSDSVRIVFGLVDIVPEFAIGDFGKKTFQINEREAIKAFKNITGTLSLEGVNMSLLLENAFGIEADVDVKTLTGINHRTGKSVALKHPDFNQTITLNRAYNPPLTPIYRIMTFNESNSSLKPFIENLPDEMHSEFNIVSRPRGSNNYTDFVFRESYLKATLRMNLPVHFGARGLTLVQKSDWNSSGNFDPEGRILSSNIYVQVLNDFPLNAQLQAYFLDEQDQVITTLFPDGFIPTIPSGFFGASAERTSYASEVILKAELDANKITLIRNAVKIKFVATFDSPGSIRHKIYDDYELRIKAYGDVSVQQKL